MTGWSGVTVVFSVEVMWNSWSNEKQDWKMLERNEMTRRVDIDANNPMATTGIDSFLLMVQFFATFPPIVSKLYWGPSPFHTLPCGRRNSGKHPLVISNRSSPNCLFYPKYISDDRRVEMYPVMQWWVVNLSLLESFLDLTDLTLLVW